MFHKKQGDTVQFYMPLAHNTFDKIYTFSIFSYSKKKYVTNDMVCGGTGFDPTIKLPKKIDDKEPDYSLYPEFKYSLGFLTRGCIRKCSWCIVPKKEGYIHAYRDIEQVANRKEVILMDNNVLACDYGLQQIEKIVKLKLKVDFNQGLDARLINNNVANLLSKVRWLKPLRMSCDIEGMIDPVKKATHLLRKYKCTPKNYFIYVLVKDIPTALIRVKKLHKMGLDPFAQPF